MGCSHFNKVLDSLDIPQLYSGTFKTHEKEAGRIIEAMAKEGCRNAAILERKLTIEKYKELKHML